MQIGMKAAEGKCSTMKNTKALPCYKRHI